MKIDLFKCHVCVFLLPYSTALECGGICVEIWSDDKTCTQPHHLLVPSFLRKKMLSKVNRER